MADPPTLADAVEQLYAAPPAEFVRTRSTLATAAKASGDTDVVRQVRGLRKPTAAAYLVNAFVRRHPQELADLADLGDRLRAAQSRLDGAGMKELGAERLTTVGRLTDQVCKTTEQVTSAVREQVSDTLAAAVADPDAYAAVRGGALVVPLRYNGFGEVDLSDALAAPLRVIQGGGSSGTGRRDAGDAADRRREAQHEAALRAASARLARAQATLERNEEHAAAAERAREHAQQKLTEARQALRSAQDACSSAKTACEEARAQVEAAVAAREELRAERAQPERV